jgi:hypothetical protein
MGHKKGDLVFQGSNWDDYKKKYGDDAALKASGWYYTNGGWKTNHITGKIASPDMDVIANPDAGISFDDYNKIYNDRRSLDPYKNADTGWIWSGSDYYWPASPGLPFSLRRLRPGEKKKSRGIFGSFAPAASFFTGGLSDLIGGKKLGEGLLGEQGASLFQDFVLSTGTAGLSDAYRGYQKYKDTGDIWAGVDRLVDPGGVVDYATRKIGSWLPDDIRSAAPSIGAAIGSLIYPVGGTAAGYGIGAKIKGGEDNYDYKGDFIGAGTAAALAYLGQQAGGLYSQPAGQAAARTTDAELQYILNDMQAALKPGYMGTLSAGVTDPELQYILDDMEAATKTGYAGGEGMASASSSGDALMREIKKMALKQGVKYLTNSLVESLAPAAAIRIISNNLTGYKAPTFSQTGNTWSVPEEEEKKEVAKQVIQQKVQDNGIKKKIGEEELQPWLEKWREPYKDYAESFTEDEQMQNYLKPKQFLNDFL